VVVTGSWTSTRTSTSIHDVELDGDVEVDPLVDLDLDRRSAILDEDSMVITGRSTCKVKEGVDVHGAVQRRGLGSTTPTTSTSSENAPALALHAFRGSIRTEDPIDLRGASPRNSIGEQAARRILVEPLSRRT
jgi:hypothetical protein